MDISIKDIMAPVFNGSLSDVWFIWATSKLAWLPQN